MKSLVEYLANITDSRKDKGKRHQLLPTLVIIIMAISCGYTTLRAMARFAKNHQGVLKEHIPLPRGKTPSLTTLHRIIKELNVQEVIKNFNDWMEQHQISERIAVDGKSIRSTVTDACQSEQNFVSLVSFFGQQSGLIVKVGLLANNKETEIKVVQEMMKDLKIEKAVFTLDALHCQKKTVAAIKESGNGYVITVKKNQKKLYRAIEEQTQTTKAVSSWSWKQRGHGHKSECRAKVYPAAQEMKTIWRGLEQVISVTRRTIRAGKAINTTTYYITSETSGAYELSQAIRDHRRIENNLHWVKDVILKEDQCGIKARPMAAVLGVFRDMSLNLLVQAGFTSVTAGIEKVRGRVGELWQMLGGLGRKLFPQSKS